MPSLDPSQRQAPPVATVRVRLFASLREAMGWSERLVIPAAPRPTPLTLWEELGLAIAWSDTTGAPAAPGPPDPHGVRLPGGLRVAINQRFSPADTPLADGDELAFLPPISGG
ncbi:MAG: MoaD/ThiS family protein [Cyanobacteriota bacterium]|jgi:molybdopterin synthase sulfur carrier subunit